METKNLSLPSRAQHLTACSYKQMETKDPSLSSQKRKSPSRFEASKALTPASGARRAHVSPDSASSLGTKARMPCSPNMLNSS